MSLWIGSSPGWEHVSLSAGQPDVGVLSAGAQATSVSRLSPTVRGTRTLALDSRDKHLAEKRSSNPPNDRVVEENGVHQVVKKEKECGFDWE
jgi:hypothetical protein